MCGERDCVPVRASFSMLHSARAGSPSRSSGSRVTGSLMPLWFPGWQGETQNVLLNYPREGMVRVQTQPPVIGSAHSCQLFVQAVWHGSS